MFAGVTPDLVCRSWIPITAAAQYPLEPELESELESSISLLLHTVCIYASWVLFVLAYGYFSILYTDVLRIRRTTNLTVWWQCLRTLAASF